MVLSWVRIETPLGHLRGRKMWYKSTAILLLIVNGVASSPQALRQGTETHLSQQGRDRAHRQGAKTSKGIVQENVDTTETHNRAISSKKESQNLYGLTDQMDPKHASKEETERCLNQFSQVSTDGLSVTQGDYVRFLKKASKGNLAYSSFSQLPAEFAMLFYSMACPSAGGRTCAAVFPVIPLGSRGLASFCNEIRTYLFTSAVVSFDYSVRYDSEKVSHETLILCLSNATKTLLSTHLGCESSSSSRQLLIGPHKELGDDWALSPSACIYDIDYTTHCTNPIREFTHFTFRMLRVYIGSRLTLRCFLSPKHVSRIL